MTARTVGFEPGSSDSPPLPGASDAPDPESHEPPTHPDSDEGISSLDVEDVIPTEGEDSLLASVALGQDEALLRTGYQAALARAEERWPHSHSVDRENWARAVANDPTRRASEDPPVIEARLNAAEAKFVKDCVRYLGQLRAQYPDADDAPLNAAARYLAGDTCEENMDALNTLRGFARRNKKEDELELDLEGISDTTIDEDEMHELADELDGEDGNHDTELWFTYVTSEDDSSLEINGLFARQVGEILNLPKELAYPMELRSAERFLRIHVPEMSETSRQICAIALSGWTSYEAGDAQGKRVSINLSDIGFWMDDVNRLRADREERHARLEELDRTVARAVEARMSEVPRGFSVEHDEPWHKTTAGKIASAVVLLAFVLAGGYVVNDRLAVQRIMEKRDAAAAEIGLVRQADGAFATVRNADELFAAAGVSQDAAEREIQIVARFASHEARLTEIETHRAELARERDTEAHRADIAESRASEASAALAFTGAQVDTATSAASDARTQARQAGQRAERAEVAARDAAATARRLETTASRTVTDVVRGGACTKATADYVSAHGALQSRWQCGAALIQCDGTDAASATNCASVSR